MDLLDSNKTNGSSDLDCLDFTVKTNRIVFSTKIALSSFAIIANFIAIGFILFTKRYKDFIYRLMAYLMFTDILQAVANMAIMAPVTVPSDGPATVKPRQMDECIASGYFSMATLWMGNVIFFWISLYLAYSGWCLYRRVGSTRDDRMESMKLKNQRPLDCTFKEIFGVLVLFIGPFAISSIPFFVNHDSYGLSGLWCWMKILKTHCGDLGNRILTLLLVFFYAPLMIIVLFALAFMTISFLCYCRGEVRKHDKDKDKKERYIKEIVIILPQPILYWTACMFLLVNRVYSTIHDDDGERPFEPLWIVHAVADSTRVMLPALAFLLHPYVWKDKVTCLSKSKPQTPSVGDTTAQNSLIPPGYGSKGYGSCNVSDADAVFANYEN